MGSLRDGLIKMADCIIKKNGANADTSDLTALPSSVKKGKIFLGRGSDNEQIGKMPIIQPERYELQLNQTLSLGEGFYDAGSTVTQNIPTLGNQYVVPSADLQTIETAGKYMEGDVFVESLPNLIASPLVESPPATFFAAKSTCLTPVIDCLTIPSVSLMAPVNVEVVSPRKDTAKAELATAVVI